MPDFTPRNTSFDAAREGDQNNSPFPSPPQSSLLPSGRLWSQTDFLSGEGLSGWVPPVYAEFRRNVLDPKYPCYFAVAGEKTGTLRYAIVDDLATGIDPGLLAEFIDLSRANPKSRHALAIFVRPEPVLRSHDFYVRLGWDLLQKLHDRDRAPWPADVPASPSHPKWEFCFGGEPMFVFGAMPSHHLRRSRNLGPSMVLLFQPRSVFQGIEGGTPAGTRARSIIRGRLAEWDLVDLHSSMGNYGDPSNYEAAQYFIPDNSEPSLPCPLVLREDREPLTSMAEHQTADETGELAIINGPQDSLEDAVRRFLPTSGSVEVQRDPVGRIHPLHTHPINETLFVVHGEMVFHVKGKDYRATAGTTIHLPAGMPHSSVAGKDGCIYLIAVN